jgi:hypothetical protein
MEGQYRDDERSGMPITSKMVCTAAHIGELIRDNRRVTLRQISIKLGLGYGIVHNVVYSELHCQEVFDRWVPRMLVDELKACYMRPFLSTVQQYVKEGNVMPDSNHC